MLHLSIVIPTCNRAEFLRRNLQSLREGVNCGYEVIVVDGASDDHTGEVLAEERKLLGERLIVICEARRAGFVRAANRGFAAATGRNMIWLNDDCRPLPGSLDEAVRQMDAAQADVGFLAMFHRFAAERNCAYEQVHEGRTFRLCHVRGTLYANFPIGRRETYRDLGYFDDRFYFYGADPDLSLKAWHAGLRVAPAFGCFIDHDEHADERRAADADRGRLDNEKLFAKWSLPPKNPSRNDFDPARPCTLRGLRSELPKVTFLISTYNRKSALLATLGQLQAFQSSIEFVAQTIVVDNASTDHTAQAVEDEFPGVRLIRLKSNLGACAKNAGLEIAQGEFIVFLDDDSFPEAGSIERMLRHFQDDPRLGAATFDVVLPDGRRECSAFPNVCIGCGTGFRREALIAAGGLPDDFFMQAEEYDLSLRILDAGWSVRRFDDLTVRHLKTSSSRQPARTTRLDIRNNLLVIARRFPREKAWPYAIDWIQRYSWMSQNKDWRHRAAFARGLAEGVMKGLWPGRRREVSQGAFEEFAKVREIKLRLARLQRQQRVRSILLIDAGKGIYAYWLAAKELGIRIVAIADEQLAADRRAYRGIAVVKDAVARRLAFDVAIISNLSPVHSQDRAMLWRTFDRRAVIDLFEPDRAAAVAA